MLGAGVFFSSYAIAYLRTQHGSDIRTVWYLMGLTMTITTVAILWAMNNGGIDEGGHFKGAVGNIINGYIKFALDLKSDIYFILSIAICITIPQLFSYFMSGLSGVAKSPIFISKSITFVIWSFIKSLTVVSGTTLTISLAGIINGWIEFAKGGALLISISIFLIMFTFASLVAYRAAGDLANENRFKSKYLSKIHNWLTRSESKEIQIEK